MATRQLVVNYRSALPTEEQTLEQVLRSCLETEITPGQRLSAAPAERAMIRVEGGRELILNEFADVIDGIAGIICEVHPGMLQPMLRRSAQQKQLTQQTLATVFEIADRAAGDSEDFVQGICYFYVRHNHVLFTTVKGFRKSELEPFFNWLLSKLNRGQVQLSAAVDRAEIGDDIGRVSKFRIRGRSGDGAGVAMGIDREVQRRLGARTVAWSKAEEVVQAILPQEAYNRLIESLGEKNRLVADVQWSVAGPRDKKVKEAIQTIVTELADLEDGIVNISGKDGEISGQSAILESTRPFEVAIENTIIIDFDHATDRLVTTLQRWVEDQKLHL